MYSELRDPEKNKCKFVFRRNSTYRILPGEMLVWSFTQEVFLNLLNLILQRFVFRKCKELVANFAHIPVVFFVIGIPRLFVVVA